MSDADWLAAQFGQHRAHLRAVAHRVLGSTTEAEDAVQEAWLRLARSDADQVENLRAWLTTVVSRIALDMLRSRATRREDPTEAPGVDRAGPADADPAAEVEIADAVGQALLVVLDRLSPSERLAFVLHDTFAVPFDEIGLVLERSPAAAKQLASRARAKVRGVDATGETDRARHRRVVEAFLRAARSGDLAGLVEVLDPDIVVAADAAAVAMGAPGATRGAGAVAAMFSGRALGAQVVGLDGTFGLAWIVAGATKVAWNFYVEGDRVVHIDMSADPGHLAGLAVRPLG